MPSQRFMANPLGATSTSLAVQSVSRPSTTEPAPGGTEGGATAPAGAIPAALGLGLGIPAWIMGHRDLAMMREGVKDPAGRGSTQGGWICGIIGTCLSAIVVLISAAMLLIMIIILATARGPGAAPGPTPGPGQQPPPGRRIEIDFHAPRGFAWLARDATIVDWRAPAVNPEPQPL